MPVRDADELLAPAVTETLAALDPRPEHAAVAKMAMQYARIIDTMDGHCTGCSDPAGCQRAHGSAWAARWVMPLLLDCLESLGATPVSRGKVREGRPANAPSGLARLRTAHGA